MSEVTYHEWIAMGAAFIVGGIAGIVGAGGAFILIPIMLTVLKIPTRITIASSLAIVFCPRSGRYRQNRLGRHSDLAVPVCRCRKLDGCPHRRDYQPQDERPPAAVRLGSSHCGDGGQDLDRYFRVSKEVEPYSS